MDVAPFLSRLFRFRNNKREKFRNDNCDVPVMIKEKFADFDSCEQIRIMLFRERFGQERRLLFDSKAMKKKNPTFKCADSENEVNQQQVEESFVEYLFKLSTSPGSEYVYKYQKLCPDVDILREMIFGAVSMSFTGTTLKVHTMRSPLRYMISVVFPAPTTTGLFTEEQDTEESFFTGCSGHKEIITPQTCKLEVARSVPVDVPGRKYSYGELLLLRGEHASLPGDQIIQKPKESSLPRSGSYNNLHRRLLINKQVQMEFGVAKQDVFDSEISGYSRLPVQDKAKLGLSIILNAGKDEGHFQDFLFTHLALLESHILELKKVVIKAYESRDEFVPLMYEGSKKLKAIIEDLYTAPRLQFPTWLTIISSTNYHDYSRSFLHKFATTLKAYDTKETNFFVSTLLTAVLTHHLAWVPTVIPSDAKMASSQNIQKQAPRWVNILAQSRPYNPLWVQLSDLYGALSFPYKFSKTVITGSKPDILLQLLQILSYFIRCSDILERLDEKMDNSEFLESELHMTNDEDSKVHNEPVVSVHQTLVISNTENNSSLELNSKYSTFSKKTVPSSIVCDIHSLKDDSEIHFSDVKHSSLSVTDGNVIMPISENNVQPHLSSTYAFVLKNSEYNNSCKKANNNSSNADSHIQPENIEKKLDVSKIAIDTTTVIDKDFSKKINACSNNNETHVVPMCKIDNCEKNCFKVDEKDKTKNSNYALSDSGYSTASKDSGSPEKEMTNSTSSSGSVVKHSDVEEGFHSSDEGKKRPCSHLHNLLEEYDNWAPKDLKDSPLPQSKPGWKVLDPTLYKSFGWSLMAGLTDHYLVDFCLQGVLGPISEEEIRKDLIRTTEIEVFGHKVKEAICILADTDTWYITYLLINYNHVE